MKRRLSVILSGIILASCLLSGCGSEPAPVATTEKTNEAVVADNSADEPDDEDISDDIFDDEDSDDTPKTYVYASDKGEMRGLTATELIAEMKTGWNLGNSLDATGPKETDWGNPVTTKQMIDTVSDKGFDIIRVPVTWYPSMNDDNVIDEQFMNRVEEVVGYGIDNGMFVILDTHHEQDGWLIPDNEHIEEVAVRFRTIWEQICERFKDYGDHLIFEGLNEPRVKGGENEWGGGTPEGRECVNRLNKLFVDTVRSSGGNNEKRLLLVATFAQAISKQAFDGMQIKYDDYTGYALHAYTPYEFTYHSGQSNEKFTWDSKYANSIRTTFKAIEKFVLSEGVPVIITECGAQVKRLEDGTLNVDEVCKWTADYYGTAKEMGIPCVRWDNNYYTSGNEYFGVLNRNTCEWYDERLPDAIMKVYE